MLVHLRDRLRAGAASGDARVFVDREDVVRYVSSFRPSHATDVAGDEKRARNAITGIVKAGLLIGTGSEERFEISEAVEPLIPLELLQELLAALVAANGTEAPSGPDDTADLFDDEARRRHRRSPGDARRGAVSMSIDEIEQTPMLDGLFERERRGHPGRRHDAVAGGAAPDGQLGRLRRPHRRTPARRRDDDLRRLGRRQEHHPRRLHGADDALGHQVQRRVQRRRRGPRPRRRPAQPAVLPARCGRRGRRPPHRSAGREAAPRQGRRHLGRDRDDVRQRPGRPVHGAPHLLRAAARDPLRPTCRCSWPPRTGRCRSTRSRSPCPSASTPTRSRSSSPASGCTGRTPSYAAVLHARLGIGANGDGAKALRLLARIQAGNQVRSVDELYKEMVLERPSTFAAADRAIEHFDDLDAAHSAMRTEEQKLELLGADHRPPRPQGGGHPAARGARLLRRDARR